MPHHVVCETRRVKIARPAGERQIGTCPGMTAVHLQGLPRANVAVLRVFLARRGIQRGDLTRRPSNETCAGTR